MERLAALVEELATRVRQRVAHRHRQRRRRHWRQRRRRGRRRRRILAAVPGHVLGRVQAERLAGDAGASGRAADDQLDRVVRLADLEHRLVGVQLGAGVHRRAGQRAATR